MYAHEFPETGCLSMGILRIAFPRVISFFWREVCVSRMFLGMCVRGLSYRMRGVDQVSQSSLSLHQLYPKGSPSGVGDYDTCRARILTWPIIYNVPHINGGWCMSSDCRILLTKAHVRLNDTSVLIALKARFSHIACLEEFISRESIIDSYNAR